MADQITGEQIIKEMKRLYQDDGVCTCGDELDISVYVVDGVNEVTMAHDDPECPYYKAATELGK